jgi:hypothetical protein
MLWLVLYCSVFQAKNRTRFCADGGERVTGSWVEGILGFIVTEVAYRNGNHQSDSDYEN